MFKALSRWVRKVLSRSERIRLWYAERDITVLQRAFQREMAAARRTGKGDPQEITSRYSSEDELATEELEAIRTQQLVRRARALRAALPSPRPRTPDHLVEFPEQAGDENWWLGRIMYQWNLTDLGEQRLRQSIREVEKAQREAFTSVLSVVTVFFGVLTGLLGVRAAMVSTQQKELSRLDHMPKIAVSADGQRLVVENTGSNVRKMTVERQVFFDVKPCVQPCAYVAPLVRYVVDDYYRDLLEGDFEGSQKLTYGLASTPGSAALIDTVSGFLQNQLRPRGLDWQGIETGLAIRVVYRDWVGTKMEECYWGESAAGGGPPLERISRKRWKRLVAVADSLRREGRKLVSTTKTPGVDAQRVLRDCIAAARR